MFEDQSLFDEYEPEVPPIEAYEESDETRQDRKSESNSSSDKDSDCWDSWAERSSGLIVFGDMENAFAEGLEADVLTGPNGGLFYRGKTNTLYGQSYSGKTWVGLVAIKEVLTKGGKGLCIDLEDAAGTAKSRKTAIGVPEEVINDKSRFLYYSPQVAFKSKEAKGLIDFFKQQQFDIVVVDSIGELASLEGVKEDADGVRFLHRSILKPLAESGACVIVIDHCAKNNEGQPTEYGAMHKRSSITGVSWLVEAEQKLKPCTKGNERDALLKMTCVKDRPGDIDANYSEFGDAQIKVAFTAYRDGSISYKVVESDDTETPVTKKLMHEILGVLYTGGSLNQGQILEEIGRNSDDSAGRAMIKKLATGDAKYVNRVKDGQAWNHTITSLGKQFYEQQNSGSQESPLSTSTTTKDQKPSTTSKPTEA